MRLYRQRGELTPVLTGNKIDPIAELDLQATVAHEVLQPDFLDDASFGTTTAVDWLSHGRVCVLGFDFGVMERRIWVWFFL